MASGGERGDMLDYKFQFATWKRVFQHRTNPASAREYKISSHVLTFLALLCIERAIRDLSFQCSAGWCYLNGTRQRAANQSIYYFYQLPLFGHCIRVTSGQLERYWPGTDRS